MKFSQTVVWIAGLLCPVQTAVGEPDWLCTGTRAMVASDSTCASQAGVDILRAGGNAIDAACAVSFALAVTRPESTGLGGGGFLIAYLADGRIVAADFRERAPAHATADMFVQAATRRPDDPPPSQIGYLAACVPGVVRGRAEVLERYGTMPLAAVIRPAIRLAREGFPVDEHYIGTCRGVARHFEKYPELKETCGYVYRRHLRAGNLPSAGERLVQPELARLLEAIAEQGPDVFYTGAVARDIERTMTERGGIIRAADLAGYKIARREPIRSRYRGYEIVSMPPSSSGGVALVETLNVLETVDLPSLWRQDAPAAWHYVAEAMKHAFADRARWLGDADFAPVPVRRLTSKGYARELAGRLRAGAVLNLEEYGQAQLPEDAGTSHFCVVDAQGNCVVSTETINTSFGCLGAVDEWGLILNNEMDDFTAVPGGQNVFGLRQSPLNAVAPGKRPLSSMTPTIVLADGKPMLLIGGSGGPRIISSVLNVILRVVDLGEPMEDAIAGRRLHHQWFPDEIVFDAPLEANVLAGLRSRGHAVSERYGTGVVQAILIRDGRLSGASDPRKGGKPAGY